jgi:glutamate 5-kinase
MPPSTDAQLAHKPQLLRRARRIVIKIGSSILSGAQGIHRQRLRRLVGEIETCAQTHQVVVVSSGAVAAGLARLGLTARPKTIPQKQAAAAVGQISLMALYERYFATHRRHVAQVLLTHDDLANRRRYLNARHALEALLQAGIVPIVNENDTVVVDEMMRHFGDNDNLSALVATLIDADLLVILSDVTGLHSADPRQHPDATLVTLVPSITKRIVDAVSEGGSAFGKGGMRSKLAAAQKATDAGIPCIVADGLHGGVLPAVFDPHQSVGTLFLPGGDRLARRKHWIAHTLRPAGSIVVDAGAYDAITRNGRSLLPKGVAAVDGPFGAGDCVSCVGPDAHEFARGLVSYSSADLDRIKGLHTSAIEATLGYKISDEIIHRNDLVLLGASDRSVGSNRSA